MGKRYILPARTNPHRSDVNQTRGRPSSYRTRTGTNRPDTPCTCHFRTAIGIPGQGQQNLADIANAIADFEPASMLVRSTDTELARSLMPSSSIDFVTTDMDDFWMRDTGPVFVQNGVKQAGVDLNFNGWGEKQEYRDDAQVAQFTAERAGVELITTDLILEGGAIEVDGEGTAIITESCVLNDNRNPGRTKAEVEQELDRLLGIKKVIWLPGIVGKDITDGHTDFYARFTSPGVVVASLDNDPQSYDYAVTRRHLEILRTATDVQGRELQVEVLEAPSVTRAGYEEEFAAGYINFYVCNGAVIAPEFGDSEADSAARTTLEKLLPERQIIQISINGVAAGGGGIQCATQQEPAL
ncbi:agmatine deiminase family protein [Acaricomes phytoseiuli]|uniref:agmatine deiminase family protein n=1 Tax=Acaricomes phytoseiuli TaxID=291968 RepID=UPI00222268AE|nr:agmatine deiminase family protein [Acaricomes phytoseiuli]MCW1249326.1 agmatine deiminase family protein [Acaricomes phytoseiuli]